MDELPEQRSAMATLVHTRGTTPKKEGAKMWVGEDGRVLGSVTIGGCVDAKVIAESEQVLRTRAPRLLSLSLGDEDAWEMGLSCGGTVEVLIEEVRVAAQEPLRAAWARIGAALALGRGAVLVRMLPDPRQQLLVLHDGATEGSLGTPQLDAVARTEALSLLARGLSRTRALTAAGAREPTAHEDAPLAFFEVHAPAAELIVVGAGHISMPLVTLARALGFRTTVLDARPRFATRERFPDADELQLGIVSELVGKLRLGPTSAVVITVHDYKVEVPVLRAVLQGEAGFVGMLGNRKRGQAVLQALRDAGVPEEKVARVQVPIGLDIGAQSAAEIGLAVLAQIVAVRAGKAGAIGAKAGPPPQLTGQVTPEAGGQVTRAAERAQ